jgi:hypothetical protein
MTQTTLHLPNKHHHLNEKDQTVNPLPNPTAQPGSGGKRKCPTGTTISSLGCPKHKTKLNSNKQKLTSLIIEDNPQLTETSALKQQPLIRHKKPGATFQKQQHRLIAAKAMKSRH